jgi:7-cyano-7-deazaguanine synthase
MNTLVIASGGIDSTAMAMMYAHHNLTLMSFQYGQKATREIEAAKRIVHALDAEHVIIDASNMKSIFGDNQLTGNIEIANEYKPSVVVPLRNAFFLLVSVIWAKAHNIDQILLGSHLDDIAEIDGERLYPDCSPEFFKSFQLAMELGSPKSEKTPRINSASMIKLSKTDLIRKAYSLNGDLIFDTWSCYKSEENHCGECESCVNRKKAFHSAGIKDKTVYVSS